MLLISWFSSVTSMKNLYVIVHVDYFLSRKNNDMFYKTFYCKAERWFSLNISSQEILLIPWFSSETSMKNLDPLVNLILQVDYLFISWVEKIICKFYKTFYFKAERWSSLNSSSQEILLIPWFSSETSMTNLDQLVFPTSNRLWAPILRFSFGNLHPNWSKNIRKSCRITMPWETIKMLGNSFSSKATD